MEGVGPPLAAQGHSRGSILAPFWTNFGTHLETLGRFGLDSERFSDQKCIVVHVCFRGRFRIECLIDLGAILLDFLTRFLCCCGVFLYPCLNQQKP